MILGAIGPIRPISPIRPIRRIGLISPKKNKLPPFDLKEQSDVYAQTAYNLVGVGILLVIVYLEEDILIHDRGHESDVG